ncbi:Slc25a29, partial [Symbiodinium microadriaticum]
AKMIYEQGGHAVVRAELTMPALPANVNSGDVVSQSREGDWPRTVVVATDALQGSTTLDVRYISLWRPCFGGGSSKDGVTGAYGEELPLSAHCLDTNTPLLVNEIQLGRPVAIQHDFLSLAGFSLQSASRMAGTPEYDIRRNFYNMGDYAHQFILNMWDADDGTPMFSESFGWEYDIIQKTVLFMSVWMEVVHEMEQAVGMCGAVQDSSRRRTDPSDPNRRRDPSDPNRRRTDPSDPDRRRDPSDPNRRRRATVDENEARRRTDPSDPNRRRDPSDPNRRCTDPSDPDRRRDPSDPDRRRRATVDESE